MPEFPVDDVRGEDAFSLHDKMLHRLREYELLFQAYSHGVAVHEMLYAPDGMPVDYRFLRVNQAFERLTGLAAEAVIGKTVREVLPEIEEFWIHGYARVVETGKPFHFEQFSRVLGREFSGVAYKTGPRGFAVTFTDITEYKRNEERLAREKALCEQVFESLPYPFLLINVADYTIAMANKASNPRGARLEGMTCYELTHHQKNACSGEEHNCPLREVVKTKRPTVAEHIHYDAQGEPRFFEVHGYPVVDDAGNVVKMIEYSIDITKRKQVEKELAYLATHDPLTDLPNRAQFLVRLGLEMEHAVRDGNKLAMILFDLDRFKEINDELGHDAGDEVLKSVGKRLKGILRKSDTAARLGGDEFLVLLPALSSIQDIESMACKIIKTLAAPLTIKGQKLRIKGSFGIAIFPDDSDNLEMLVKYADMAMYRVKGAGGDGYRLYGAQRDGDAATNLSCYSTGVLQQE